MSEARLPLRIIVLSTVVALAAAVGTYVLLSDDDGGGDPPVNTIPLVPEGQEPEADGVSFTTFEGEVVALSSLQGQPVLVNFFASNCTPCITEMPDLEEVHQELGDQVVFLGLATNDRPEDAQDLVDRTGVTYRTAQDKDGSAMTALGGVILPTTVLLDADGEIVTTHLGKIDADGLRALIADELGISA